jgi:hypothetical protein
MILTSITISLASLGFRAITDKGMILYFLRRPFDRLIERIKDWEKFNEEMKGKGTYMMHPIPHYKLIIYLFKPIHLCSTCMSSVHTLIWWPYLVGSYSVDTILTMLIVAFLNSFGWGIIELINRK